MTAARLPVSIMTSLALHAAGLAAYLHMAHMSHGRHARVIGNVDLLIQVRKAAALPKPLEKASTPPSTWNFLKMALPAVPKVVPQRLEVKVPEVKKTLMGAPKLEDKGRREAQAKLEALDLSQKRVEMAKVDQKLETRRVQALAALPQLEEVGRRRVKNLPEAIALEERRQEAVALQSIEKIGAASHRHLLPAAELLKEEAAPERSKLSARIASFLPVQEERRELEPQMREAPEPIRKKLDAVVAPSLDRHKADVLEEEKKKVEIEGPLAGRKVAAYDLPEFPSWARDQGIMEAAVAIRFSVSPAGEVLASMRVERTSGYGRLDRLAMESLKRWKFEPLATEERQWGIITFRFVLE